MTAYQMGGRAALTATALWTCLNAFSCSARVQARDAGFLVPDAGLIVADGGPPSTAAPCFLDCMGEPGCPPTWGALRRALSAHQGRSEAAVFVARVLDVREDGTTRYELRSGGQYYEYPRRIARLAVVAQVADREVGSQVEYAYSEPGCYPPLYPPDFAGERSQSPSCIYPTEEPGLRVGEVALLIGGSLGFGGLDAKFAWNLERIDARVAGEPSDVDLATVRALYRDPTTRCQSTPQDGGLSF